MPRYLGTAKKTFMIANITIDCARAYQRKIVTSWAVTEFSVSENNRYFFTEPS